MPAVPPLDTSAELYEYNNDWIRNDATPAFQSLRLNTFNHELIRYIDNIIITGGGEPTITPGTTAQYWRGDKTWQTLDKTAVGLPLVQNVDQTNAANLLSGLIPAGRYGASTIPVSAINATGTPSASTVLFGNGTWGTYALADGDKGDITISSGGTVWTIDDDAITLNKLPEISANRVLGRILPGVGDVAELTGTEVTTMLSVFTSSLNGVVPLSGGGTVNFLRADGVWADPAAGGGGLSDGDKGDITVSSAGTVWTIDALAVTNGKINDVAFSKVTGTIGAAQVAGTATNGYVTTLVAGVPTWQPATGTLADGDYGDIVVTSSGSVWTIENSSVTVGKMQNISTASFLGRATAGSGIIEVLTGTQATELLNVFSSTLKGLVPSSGGGTTNFLRADGTWAAPPGGGGGSGTVNSGTQYRIGYYATTGTAISEAGAITAARALISDANGVPTHSTVTTTEIGHVGGVTSSIQTQLNAKQATLVSGTNIKTVGGVSILGSGDIAMLNVDVNSPADGDILVYDTATSTWVNQANTGGGGVSGLTATRIPVAASATSLTDYSALTWDTTYNRIIIGGAGGANSYPGIVITNPDTDEGTASIAVTNNAGGGGSMIAFPASYVGVPNFTNAFVFGAHVGSSKMLMYTDGNLSDGGTTPIIINPGGYEDTAELVRFVWISSNAYMNWGDNVSGSSGIGFRLNTSTGNMEVKHTGGSWAAIGSNDWVPSANAVTYTNNGNTSKSAIVSNNNTGTGALANFNATNGSNGVGFGITSTGYTPYGILGAGTAHIYSSANIAILSDGGNIKFGTASGTERMTISTTGVRINSLGGSGSGVVLVDNNGDLSWGASGGGGDMVLNALNDMGASGRIVFNDAITASTQFQVGGLNLQYISAQFGYIFNNLYFNGSNYTYGATGSGQLLSMGSDEFGFHGAASGTGGTTTAIIDMMRIGRTYGAKIKVSDGYLNFGTDATTGSSSYGIWDNGGKIKYKNSTGGWRNITPLEGSQTADATVSNTTTETSIVGTAAGSWTVDGAGVTAGTIIRQKGSGTVQTSSGGRDVTFTFYLNASTSLGRLVSGLPASSTIPYWFETVFLIKASGTGQAITGTYILHVSSTTYTGVLTATTDTNTNMACDIKVQWSAASASNTVTSYYNSQEVFRP